MLNVSSTMSSFISLLLKWVLFRLLGIFCFCNKSTQVKRKNVLSKAPRSTLKLLKFPCSFFFLILTLVKFSKNSNSSLQLLVLCVFFPSCDYFPVILFIKSLTHIHLTLKSGVVWEFTFSSRLFLHCCWYEKAFIFNVGKKMQLLYRTSQSKSEWP